MITPRVGRRGARRYEERAAWSFPARHALYSERTGEAIKMELYVPAAMPTSRAKAKSLSVASPKIRSATMGMRLKTEVKIDRLTTWRMDRLIISSKRRLL